MLDNALGEYVPADPRGSGELFARQRSRNTPPGMPSLQFYAIRADLPDLLGFVLTQTDCRVYEAYSVPDRALRQFASVADIMDAFPPAAELSSAETETHLALWSPSAGGQVRVRRIDLAPRAIPGATHRYTAEGWGLIQLRLGGVNRGGISSSGLAHNSEARARKWHDSMGDRLGSVDDWDWKAIASVARQFRYHVQGRLAVDTVGSRPILRAAQRMREKGFELRP